MEQNVIRSFNPTCLRQDCHFVHSCLAKDEPCMCLSEQEKADMREIELRNKFSDGAVRLLPKSKDAV